MGPGFFRSLGSRPGAARRLRALACAALACWALVPVAAAAKNRAAADSDARILAAGSVASSTTMNFGTIAVTSPGTVVLTAAASPTCTASAGLTRTGPCTAAMFEGRVRFFFPLQYTPPAGGAINLTGPGGATMRVDAFTFAAGPGLLTLGGNRFLILNLNGNYSFYVGGTLHVGANQTPGTYNGTFLITLNYN